MLTAHLNMMVVFGLDIQGRKKAQLICLLFLPIKNLQLKYKYTQLKFKTSLQKGSC
jgi:hypothetical protein